MNIDPTIREESLRYFLQEAGEILQALEKELLNLTEDTSTEKINTLMRLTHTLKGASAMLGLETIKTVASSLEDIFQALRKPQLSIDTEVQALLFESLECLRLPILALSAGGQVNDAEILEEIANISQQIQAKLGQSFKVDLDFPSSQELGFDLVQSIFEIGVAQRLGEMLAVLDSGDEPAIVNKFLSEAEVFQGLANSLNLPGFGAIATAMVKAFELNPDLIMAVAQIAIADLMQARNDIIQGDRSSGGQPSLTLQQLASSEILNNSEEPANSLLDTVWGMPVDLNTNQTSSEPGTNLLLEGSEIITEYIEQPQEIPKIEQEEQPKPVPPKERVSSSQSVRVNVEHLQHLNYTIGELLTNQNRQSLQNEQLQAAIGVLTCRIKQHSSLLEKLKLLGNHDLRSPSGASDSELQSLIQSLLEDTVQLSEASDAVEFFGQQSNETLEKQHRLLNSTRDALMGARMSPLGDIFLNLPLMLQQLEILYKKQVKLEISGNLVLVDKVVAEKLYEPLLHLIRNAFDHGIEAPEIRQKLGKPPQGLIEICAYHQGIYLIIEIKDDGRGLNFELIRQRAVENKFLSPEQARNMTEALLTDLLFEPGFSTKSDVNDLSGRGVGLDIVRSQCRAIQGAIAVSSIPNRLTKFKLQIPLSLTIAKLLLVQAEDRIYALYADAVEQALKPQPTQIRSWSDGKVLRWYHNGSEQLIPVYQLSKALNYSSTLNTLVLQPTPKSGQQTNPIILIRSQDRLLGLEIDQIIGEQELLIRPLGQLIAAPKYIDGSCILPDSRLTLVLDAAALMQRIVEQPSSGDRNLPVVKLYAPGSRDVPNSAPRLFSATRDQQQLPLQTRAVLIPQTPKTDFTANSQKKVLVVDDSITVRQTLNLALQKAGYQVIQAKDGCEGLEQLQQVRGISLIISDIEMPRMNGFEFLKSLQQNQAIANIPVIMLTSRSGQKYRPLALQLGAKAYITKPYLEYKLLAIVKQLLSK